MSIFSFEWGIVLGIVVGIIKGIVVWISLGGILGVVIENVFGIVLRIVDWEISGRVLILGMTVKVEFAIGVVFSGLLLGMVSGIVEGKGEGLVLIFEVGDFVSKVSCDGAWVIFEIVSR